MEEETAMEETKNAAEAVEVGSTTGKEFLEEKLEEKEKVEEKGKRVEISKEEVKVPMEAV